MTTNEYNYILLNNEILKNPSLAKFKHYELAQYKARKEYAEWLHRNTAFHQDLFLYLLHKVTTNGILIPMVSECVSLGHDDDRCNS